MAKQATTPTRWVRTLAEQVCNNCGKLSCLITVLHPASAKSEDSACGPCNSRKHTRTADEFQAIPVTHGKG